MLAVALPAALLFKQNLAKYLKIIASVSIIVGTFLGKMIFVYGGNVYPMNNRFGVGFEKYNEYEQAKEMIFFMPPLSEIAIVVGSIGIILFIFRLADMLLSVSKASEH